MIPTLPVPKLMQYRDDIQCPPDSRLRSSYTLDTTWSLQNIHGKKYLITISCSFEHFVPTKTGSVYDYFER